MLSSDSQVLHPLCSEQVAAFATVARPATKRTVETINLDLINCMAGRCVSQTEHYVSRSAL